MLSVLRDVRFAFRQFSRTPGFALTAVTTLALGIGATASIFSLAETVLLRPLPFPHASRLMWVQQADHTPGLAPGKSEPLSYPDYFDWRARNRSFDELASYRGASFTMTGEGQAQQIRGMQVSANFFRTLEVSPEIGRDFRLEDERAGGHVAILSHQMWRSTFGGTPGIAGRMLTLDGVRYTVVGVIPAGMAFPVTSPEIWVTIASDAETAGAGKPVTEQRGDDMLDVVGRVRAGVTAEQARTDLSAIANAIASQFQDTNKYYTSAAVTPMLEHLTGDYRGAIRILFAAVVCLLLIACSNVAGLLLVNANRRAPELAVRIALGASRSEISRQILVESVLLSLAGGALGMLLAGWVLQGMIRFVPESIPRLDQIAIDGTVLAFATAVSVLTGVLFGALPAWRASRLDPALQMRDFGRGSLGSRGRGRMQGWIVAAETAVSLLLLTGSGLLIRSFVKVTQVDPGFDSHHVLTATASVPEPAYTDAQRVQFYDELRARLAATPGVQMASAGWPLPLGEGHMGISFQIEERMKPESDEPTERLGLATPNYFATMRIPLISGRTFDEHDVRKSKPVIIVNQAFAKKYFPGEDPLGKRIRCDASDDGTKPPMREVVGVVGDVRRERLQSEPEPFYYLPYTQAVFTSPAICIRTAGDPVQFIRTLRQIVQEIDPNIPLYRIRTMDEMVATAASEPRFHMMLFTSFAVLALVLSAVGLYAVLSYMVAQRTREIGLRIALGAQPGDLMRWVLRRGMALAAAGSAAGLVLSLVLTNQMQEMLFGVGAMDAGTFVVSLAATLVVAVAASCLPALRASRLSPMRAMQE
jgi:predicted permease